jgi:hypothetical protein
MTWHLFGQAKQGQTWREALCPGAVVLRGVAVPDETAISAANYPHRVRSLALTNGDVHDNWPPRDFSGFLDRLPKVVCPTRGTRCCLTSTTAVRPKPSARPPNAPRP